MKTTLVLYSKGNVKQFKDFPDKENCMFVNTKYRNLTSDTQGMRFTQIVINDLGVSLEDEAYANSIQVTKTFWDSYCKTTYKELKENLITLSPKV